MPLHATRSDHMPVRFGILLPGAKPLGLGINSALRGFADVAGEEVPVVAKAVAPAEIMAECFCSLLALAIGLPAAEPLILFDHNTRLPMFGSEDQPHPNLSQLLTLDQHPNALRVWGELMAGWPALADVVAFDEWINNRDRNPGNILWKDEAEFVLIDHGKALNIDPNYPDQNKLVIAFQAVRGGDELGMRRLLRAALRSAEQYQSEVAQTCAIEIAGMCSPDPGQEFARFVCERLRLIDNHIRGRFPQQQMRMDV